MALPAVESNAKPINLALNNLVIKASSADYPISLYLPTQGTTINSGCENKITFNKRVQLTTESGKKPIPLTEFYKTHSVDLVRMVLEQELAGIMPDSAKQALLKEYEGDMKAMGFSKVEYEDGKLIIHEAAPKGTPAEKAHQKADAQINRFVLILDALSSNLDPISIMQEVKRKGLKEQQGLRLAHALSQMTLKADHSAGNRIQFEDMFQALRQCTAESADELYTALETKANEKLSNAQAETKLQSFQTYTRLVPGSGKQIGTATDFRGGLRTIVGKEDMIKITRIEDGVDSPEDIRTVDPIFLKDHLVRKRAEGVFFPPSFHIAELKARNEIQQLNQASEDLGTTTQENLGQKIDLKRQKMEIQQRIFDQRNLMRIVMMEQTANVSLEKQYEGSDEMLDYIKRLKRMKDPDSTDPKATLYDKYQDQFQKRHAQIKGKDITLDKVQSQLVRDFIVQLMVDQGVKGRVPEGIIEEITNMLVTPAEKGFEARLNELGLNKANRDLVRQYFDARKKDRKQEMTADERIKFGFQASVKREVRTQAPVFNGIFARAGLYLDDATKTSLTTLYQQLGAKASEQMLSTTATKPLPKADQTKTKSGWFPAEKVPVETTDPKTGKPKTENQFQEKDPGHDLEVRPLKDNETQPKVRVAKVSDEFVFATDDAKIEEDKPIPLPTQTTTSHAQAVGEAASIEELLALLRQHNIDTPEQAAKKKRDERLAQERAQAEEALRKNPIDPKELWRNFRVSADKNATKQEHHRLLHATRMSKLDDVIDQVTEIAEAIPGQFDDPQRIEQAVNTLASRSASTMVLEHANVHDTTYQKKLEEIRKQFPTDNAERQNAIRELNEQTLQRPKYQKAYDEVRRELTETLNILGLKARREDLPLDDVELTAKLQELCQKSTLFLRANAVKIDEVNALTDSPKERELALATIKFSKNFPAGNVDQIIAGVLTPEEFKDYHHQDLPPSGKDQRQQITEIVAATLTRNLVEVYLAETDPEFANLDNYDQTTHKHIPYIGTRNEAKIDQIVNSVQNQQIATEIKIHLLAALKAEYPEPKIKEYTGFEEDPNELIITDEPTLNEPPEFPEMEHTISAPNKRPPTAAPIPAPAASPGRPPTATATEEIENIIQPAHETIRISEAEKESAEKPVGSKYRSFFQDELDARIKAGKNETPAVDVDALYAGLEKELGINKAQRQVLQEYLYLTDLIHAINEGPIDQSTKLKLKDQLVQKKNQIIKSNSSVFTYNEGKDGVVIVKSICNKTGDEITRLQEQFGEIEEEKKFDSLHSLSLISSSYIEEHAEDIENSTQYKIDEIEGLLQETFKDETLNLLDVGDADSSTDSAYLIANAVLRYGTDAQKATVCELLLKKFNIAKEQALPVKDNTLQGSATSDELLQDLYPALSQSNPAPSAETQADYNKIPIPTWLQKLKTPPVQELQSKPDRYSQLKIGFGLSDEEFQIARNGEYLTVLYLSLKENNPTLSETLSPAFTAITGLLERSNPKVIDLLNNKLDDFRQGLNKETAGREINQADKNTLDYLYIIDKSKTNPQFTEKIKAILDSVNYLPDNLRLKDDLLPIANAVLLYGSEAQKAVVYEYLQKNIILPENTNPQSETFQQISAFVTALPEGFEKTVGYMQTALQEAKKLLPQLLGVPEIKVVEVLHHIDPFIQYADKIEGANIDQMRGWLQQLAHLSRLPSTQEAKQLSSFFDKIYFLRQTTHPDIKPADINYPKQYIDLRYSNAKDLFTPDTLRLLRTNTAPVIEDASFAEIDDTDIARLREQFGVSINEIAFMAHTETKGDQTVLVIEPDFIPQERKQLVITKQPDHLPSIYTKIVIDRNVAIGDSETHQRLFNVKPVEYELTNFELKHDVVVYEGSKLKLHNSACQSGNISAYHDAYLEANNVKFNNTIHSTGQNSKIELSQCDLSNTEEKIYSLLTATQGGSINIKDVSIGKINGAFALIKPGSKITIEGTITINGKTITLQKPVALTPKDEKELVIKTLDDLKKVIQDAQETIQPPAGPKEQASSVILKLLKGESKTPIDLTQDKISGLITEFYNYLTIKEGPEPPFQQTCDAIAAIFSEKASDRSQDAFIDTFEASLRLARNDQKGTEFIDKVFNLKKFAQLKDKRFLAALAGYKAKFDTRPPMIAGDKVKKFAELFPLVDSFTVKALAVILPKSIPKMKTYDYTVQNSRVDADQSSAPKDADTLVGIPHLLYPEILAMDNAIPLENRVKTALLDGRISIAELMNWQQDLLNMGKQKGRSRFLGPDRWLRGGLTKEEDAQYKTLLRVCKQGVADVNGTVWKLINLDKQKKLAFRNGATDVVISNETLPILSEQLAQKIFIEVRANGVVPASRLSMLVPLLTTDYFNDPNNINTTSHLYLEYYHDLPLIFRSVMKRWGEISRTATNQDFVPEDQARYAEIRAEVNLNCNAAEEWSRQQGAEKLIDEPTRARYARELYAALPSDIRQWEQPYQLDAVSRAIEILTRLNS